MNHMMFMSTEVGDVSHGGVSVWVDYWLQNMGPYLVTKPVLLIEVEQKEEWDIYVKQFVDVIHNVLIGNGNTQCLVYL